MSDTSKREELIRALAADVHDEYGWLSDAQHARLEWDESNRVVHFCGEGSIDVGHVVAMAEDVFEQAHTPTDDERDRCNVSWAASPEWGDRKHECDLDRGHSGDHACGWCIACEFSASTHPEPIQAAIERVLDEAGYSFRRTAVQEPTDDERGVIDQVRAFASNERDSTRGRYGAGSSTYAGYANACDDILGILDDLSPYPDALRPVQGEPTDAEIDAFKREWWAAKDEGDDGNKVRRGLRAAYEEGKKR